MTQPIFLKVKNLIHKFVEENEDGEIIEEKNAVDDVSLEVEKGQFIVILGHNGSGKSTLAKHINAILAPTSGTLFVNGKNTAEEENIWDIRQSAGMVFQNPDNQIIATVVEEDVGFGPENIGVPTEEIWKRVEQSLKSVGMWEYRHHSPAKLSGGQKQRVAIAGVLAMKPDCIVLDEPTAMLDPDGRREVMETLHELNKKEQVTIILITHHMNESIDADKIFVMNKGKIALQGTPKEVFSHYDEIKKIGLDVPFTTEITHLFNAKGWDLPVGMIEKQELISRLKNKKFAKNTQVDTISSGKKREKKNPILTLQHIHYIYSPDSIYRKQALQDVNLDIFEGEFIGIIGHTGSGKSTLIQHFNGLNLPSSGEVFYKGKNICDEDFKLSDLRKHVGLVFQYPEHQLFESTVLLDVAFGPKNLGYTKKEAEVQAKEALQLVGMGEEFFEKSPFELSGGQKRRVAIAGVLAMKPEILVLDEPTAALDPRGQDEIFSILKDLHEKNNLTIILVSHSMEDMAEYAGRIIVMDKGKKVMDDEPIQVFKRHKELEDMGLAAPEITYFLEELHENGIPVDTNILNVGQAAEQIYQLWNGAKES